MYNLEYGVTATITFALVDFGATDFEATPVTFASGDTQISKDGGTFANTTNNPSHVGNGVYKLVLTATEAQAYNVAISVIDQTDPKEWEDQLIVATTVNHASAQIPNFHADVVEISGDSTAADNAELMFDGTGYAGGTTPLDVNVKQVSGDATAADNLELDYDGTGYAKANSTIGVCSLVTTCTTVTTCTANTDMRGTDSAYTGTPPTAIENADALLTRDIGNVEGSAPVHSMTSMVLKLVSRFVAVTGVTYRTDGTTTHMTQTPTVDASADPIVELGAGT